jgi:hypothetical protein
MPDPGESGHDERPAYGTDQCTYFRNDCRVELNAVRARLAELPEQWRWSSAWTRKNGQAEWLIPLEELVETSDPTLAGELYWTSLYWRGTRPGKETDATPASTRASAAGALRRVGLREAGRPRILRSTGLNPEKPSPFKPPFGHRDPRKG